MASTAQDERKPQAGGKPGNDGFPVIWTIFGDDALSQRLLLLAKMIERVTSRRLQQQFSLSVAQWRVLAFVCISGPATASYIGEAAEVDQAEISRAVKALLDRGTVRREFEPGSRKTLIIAPTAEGSELFARVREKRQAYFARITRGLDAGQRKALNGFLEAIASEVIAERNQAGADG